MLEISFTKYYASLKKKQASRYFKDAFWRIMSCLPLRHIGYLYLYCLPLMECPRIAFSGLHGVKTLRIYGREALPLLTALMPHSQPNRPEDSDDGDEIPLPALKNLFLPSPFFSGRFTEISAFIVNRAKCQVPIQKLSLANRRCVPDDSLKDLYDRVPVVRFDTDKKKGAA